MFQSLFYWKGGLNTQRRLLQAVPAGVSILVLLEGGAKLANLV